MAKVIIEANPDTISEGGFITLTASPAQRPDPKVVRTEYHWECEAGRVEPTVGLHVRWYSAGLIPGAYGIRVHGLEYDEAGDRIRRLDGGTTVTVTEGRTVAAAPKIAERPVAAAERREATPPRGRALERTAGAPITAGGASGATSESGGGFPSIPTPLPVTLERSHHYPTTDQILWTVIRANSRRMSFDHYDKVIDAVLAWGSKNLSTPRGENTSKVVEDQLQRLQQMAAFYDPYTLLKAATEAFVMVECRVHNFHELRKEIDINEEKARYEDSLLTKDGLADAWAHKDHGYLEPLDHGRALPYLALVSRRLPALQVDNPEEMKAELKRVQEKLKYPCFLELIWSYWHDEGGLVQTFNHVSERFQNVRPPGDSDPLAKLAIDPLNPLNELLWGYIQDELGHTSVIRRAHEYARQYGFSLEGKALASLRPAERRTKFLESFHNLLNRCVRFYAQDDNTTIVADGFPLLNSIKETHYLLAQGASNQFGGLAALVRQEMLMQQWLLARPEMQEFLGGRIMVPYPEPWMDRVDTMKTLQGWTDVSIVHFHDLAMFGEQLLLSIRYGNWSKSNDANQAANWARYWRQEVQGYIHAYRAATSVDLAAEVTEPQLRSQRYLPPSQLLTAREAAQRRRRP